MRRTLNCTKHPFKSCLALRESEIVLVQRIVWCVPRSLSQEEIVCAACKELLVVAAEQMMGKTTAGVAPPLVKG